MTIDIVMCGDRRVIWGMAVTGRSALDFTNETINFWIICQSYSEDDKAMLCKSWAHSKLGTITFKNVPKKNLNSFRSTSYLKSKVAYARYYISEFFPRLQRCVYLDTDLLVLRDLSEVMNIDFGDKAIAGVVDVGIRTTGAVSDVGTRLSLRDGKAYFNSGFLIIDLQFWRNNNLTNKIVTLSIEKRDILHSQDQDALNMIFDGRVKLLDPVWNTSQYEKPNPIDGRIIHLIGTVKPWHARYVKKFVEPYYRDTVYERFYAFLDQTAFAGKRPWNPFGIGFFIEWADAKFPTIDMVSRKLLNLMVGKNR